VPDVRHGRRVPLGSPPRHARRHGGSQGIDAGAGLRRHPEDLEPADRIERPSSFEVRLVRGHHASRTFGDGKNVAIVGRERLRGVEDHDGQIRHAPSRMRACDAFLFHGVRRGGTQAGRVDQRDGDPVDIDDFRDEIARGARDVRDDCPAGAS
jgi:hypothetical protein